MRPSLSILLLLHISAFVVLIKNASMILCNPFASTVVTSNTRLFRRYHRPHVAHDGHRRLPLLLLSRHLETDAGVVWAFLGLLVVDLGKTFLSIKSATYFF